MNSVPIQGPDAKDMLLHGAVAARMVSIGKDAHGPRD
jgi:hypothetical protein